MVPVEARTSSPHSKRRTQACPSTSTLFDSCAAALAKIHEVCGADAYSKIDVTGMTPKEAAAAYKKVAKECAAAGKDVSASCGSKKPDDGSGEDGPR